MALPPGVETPRGLELHAKLEAAYPDLKDWTQPTKEDFVLFGALVVLFSHFELEMRRLIDVFEYKNVLPEQWRGKGASLFIGDVEKAVLAAPVWTGDHDIAALQELIALRPIRNLVAHFVPRRFPNDDAFLFITKSVKDFKKVHGIEPDVGMALTAVVERERLVEVLKRVEHILGWLTKVVLNFEKHLPPVK